MASAEFQVKLQHAVADPKCQDAKYVLKKLIPVLTNAGKNTSFGPLERNSSLAETYAMMRRFGCAISFVTISIDDVSTPHTFCLTFSQQYNEHFPAIASDNFPHSMEQGNIFADGKVKIPLNWSTPCRFGIHIQTPLVSCII